MFKVPCAPSGLIGLSLCPSYGLPSFGPDSTAYFAPCDYLAELVLAENAAHGLEYEANQTVQDREIEAGEEEAAEQETSEDEVLALNEEEEHDLANVSHPQLLSPPHSLEHLEVAPRALNFSSQSSLSNVFLLVSFFFYFSSEHVRFNANICVYGGRFIVTKILVVCFM